MDNEKKVPLKDEELDQVNGGFKFLLKDPPKFIKTLLRLFFGIKEKTKDED